MALMRITAFDEIDVYILENYRTITCHEMFTIKQNFYNEVEALCGSTANLTGITEFLICRFMYHWLGMTRPIQDKKVENDNGKLLIGNRYLGRNGKFQEPDIVIERGNAIKYLLSIKNSLATATPTVYEKASALVQELIKEHGGCTNAIQDIFRIDNIRCGAHSDFKSMTIVFSKLPKKQEGLVKLINERFESHHFLFLENNHHLILDEINDKLSISYDLAFENYIP